MIPLIYPIGAGALALIALRLRATSKKKTLAAASAANQAPANTSVPASAIDRPIVAPAVPLAPEDAPQAVREAAAAANLVAAKANPAPANAVSLAAQQSGVTVADIELAARFLGLQSGDPNFTAAQFVAMGVSPQDVKNAVFQAKNAQQNVSAPIALDAPITSTAVEAVSQQLAVVTTHDQPPSGDLRVFATASTAQQIGGADKDGVVAVLDSSDPTFALISWAGGRNPAVQGFAKKQFLRNI